MYQDIERYSTIGDIQCVAKNIYEKHHRCTPFLEILNYLLQNNKVLAEKPSSEKPNRYGILDDESFLRLMLQLPINVASIMKTVSYEDIREKNIIPENKDVFSFLHLRYIDDGLHMHDYFEVNYVYLGSCLQIFENEKRMLTEGEFCIIAPDSRHSVLVENSSVVLSITIRKSTFDSLFWNLLVGDDLLSIFFQNTLYGNSQSNYLLFKTNNFLTIKMFMQHIIFETNLDDNYSNNCSISLLNLVFAMLLREFGSTVYSYRDENTINRNLDFVSILQYLQNNYQTVTLFAAAEHFHYNENYLSRLIKKNLNQSFSDTIRNLKMQRAEQYLIKTTKKIYEISELVGYDSVDQFSRTFKDYFDVSPSVYRRKHSV